MTSDERKARRRARRLRRAARALGLIGTVVARGIEQWHPDERARDAARVAREVLVHITTGGADADAP